MTHINNRIHDIAAEATQWRRHLHENPETAFEEVKTSAFVKQKLQEFGIEVHGGFAKTGLVGVLKNGTSKKAIGFRADMDALPMDEETNIEWQSKTPKKMHACGHDGHTATLLATAKYLAETKNFDGTVYFYFQPAEEFGGGANIMIQDGAFDKFKPDEVYAYHNSPGVETGKIAIREGEVMASPDNFTITVKGKGGHAAYPHKCKDTIIISMELGLALQTIVSRNVSPFDTAVLSVTRISSGDAYNVIPARAEIWGTVRTFKPEVKTLIVKRMEETIKAMEIMHDVEIDLLYEDCYPVTKNHPLATEASVTAAISTVGEDNILESEQSMGGEDFSYMQQQAPGCMAFIGNGDSYPVHHPKYDFNDEIIPVGVQWFTNLAQQRLPVK